MNRNYILPIVELEDFIKLASNMKNKNKDMHFFLFSLALMFVVAISLLGVLKITSLYIARAISVEEKEIIAPINEERKIEKNNQIESDPLIVPASKVKTRE